MAYSAPNYQQNSVQFYNQASESPAWVYDYDVTGMSLQDVPAAIRGTDDLEYFAVGSWGSNSDSNEEVRVFSRSKADGPIAKIHASGSVFDVDLTENPSDKNSLLLTYAGKVPER